MNFIQENIGNIITGAFLILLVISIVRHLIHEKKVKGCSSHCSGCAQTCSIPEMKKGLSEYSASKEKKV